MQKQRAQEKKATAAAAATQQQQNRKEHEIDTQIKWSNKLYLSIFGATHLFRIFRHGQTHTHTPNEIQVTDSFCFQFVSSYSISLNSKILIVIWSQCSAIIFKRVMWRERKKYVSIASIVRAESRRRRISRKKRDQLQNWFDADFLHPKIVSAFQLSTNIINNFICQLR